MEVIFATVIGCVLSFLCGAVAVYMRDYFAVPKQEKTAEIPQDPKMVKQWESFLNYKGDE